MKRILLLILVCLSFLACAGQAIVSAQVFYDTDQVRYAVIPESPSPGDPVTIAINKEVKEAVLIINGRQLSKTPFMYIPDDPGIPCYFAAILTIPNTVTSQSAIIRINDNAGLICEIPITITPKEFYSETIQFNPANTNLVSGHNPQRDIESQRLWQILSTTGDQIYHTGRFVLPVTSTRRTSTYASRRINRYSDGRSVTNIHAGIDFGIPTGTPVIAAGAGKVILARMRIVSGYSVIIEHWPGMYSLYYHLDSISVQEGAIVKTGELIGLSGSTGFSTGPHLHWELRINTESADPDTFVNRPVIDKNQIIYKIFNIERTDPAPAGSGRRNNTSNRARR